MRVVQVLPSLDFGGVETLRLELGRCVRPGGPMELRFVALAGGGFVADELRRIGHHVDVLGTSGHPLDPRVTFALWRYLQGHPADVVHAAILEANVHSAIAGMLARAPVIVTEEVGVPARRPRWARTVAAIAHKQAALIVAESASIARYLGRAEHVTPSRIRVVYNCASAPPSDPGDRGSVRAELGMRPEDIVIGSVGRLVREKAFEILIRAVADLCRSRSDVRLVLVGDGPERDRLRAMAIDEGAGGAVHLIGKRADVHRLLRGFDIFVLPSRSEGLGIAIIEAMLAGLPVIATAVDGISEVIRDPREGILVPPEDRGALLEALLGVIDDPRAGAAMGAHAAIVARSRFAPERYVTDLSRVYEEATRLRSRQ